VPSELAQESAGLEVPVPEDTVAPTGEEGTFPGSGQRQHMEAVRAQRVLQ